MQDSHVTTLADGRELGWVSLGDDGAWPILGFHGTPGSRLSLELAEPVTADGRVRLVLCDRPGYGLSTYDPARRLGDWPRDVAALADHLGLERFSVLGWSGGGPHALACAAMLADRVAVVGVASGVAPLDDPASSEGMVRSNQVITTLARRRSPLLRALAQGQMALGRRFPSRAVDLMARRLPACDAAVLARREVRELFELELARTSRDAGRAVAQDFELFASPWGVELSAISVPVHLWQGDADQNVPMAHAERLHAAIPTSTLHACPGEGHFLIVDRMEEIATALLPG